MKITKSIWKLENEIVGLKCDRCKREYLDKLETQEFVKIDFIGGYGSIFGDGHSVEADICQHCLKEIMGSFLVVSSTSLIY